MALSYEEGKKVFMKTILILGAITILEVAFALLGKGYLIEGVHFPHLIIRAVMIIMSVVKAYLIVYEFMHMKYEAKGLSRSVVLPGLLLVWGVIAFLWDGTHWKDRRSTDSVPVELTVPAATHDHSDTHDGHGHDVNDHEDDGHGHDVKNEDHH